MIKMPYKDRTKQQQYMRRYRTPYMRTYRKRKITVDEAKLEELKKKFPSAYDLLLSKPESKKKANNEKVT